MNAQRKLPGQVVVKYNLSGQLSERQQITAFHEKEIYFALDNSISKSDKTFM